MIILKVVMKRASSNHDAPGMCATSRSNVSNVVKTLEQGFWARSDYDFWSAYDCSAIQCSLLSTCDIPIAHLDQSALQPLLP